ncbi:hypothetical protein ACFYXM_08585 [Streptomyces sp. NPDC002476]|uniref:hypothetical protein n=1 Tax=Streptomyces sp. NPDC002476 TaxID=3364648 RepID=UPI0036CFED20
MDHSDLLRAEDLPAFERILDRALGSPLIQEGRRRNPGSPNNEQLRTRALGARTAIAASAAAEYRAYRQLLDDSGNVANARGAVRRESGAGTAVRGSALHAVAVLVPGLSATAAAVFGVIGFGFRAVGSHSHLAEVMLGAGAVAAGVAVVTVLAGLVGLLVVAAGNRSTKPDGDAEVDRAREAWQGALLERGALPFLVDAIHPPSSGAGGVEVGTGGTGTGAQPHTRPCP